jgi:hypothetical protein
MAQYKLQFPEGQSILNLSCSVGSFNFVKTATDIIIDNDALARHFPRLFKKIGGEEVEAPVQQSIPAPVIVDIPNAPIQETFVAPAPDQTETTPALDVPPPIETFENLPEGLEEIDKFVPEIPPTASDEDIMRLMESMPMDDEITEEVPVPETVQEEVLSEFLPEGEDEIEGEDVTDTPGDEQPTTQTKDEAQKDRVKRKYNRRNK